MVRAERNLDLRSGKAAARSLRLIFGVYVTQFIEKISSYLVVSHFKQSTIGKIDLTSRYLFAAFVMIGIVIATVYMIFS